MPRNGSGVYTAPASSFNPAVTSNSATPIDWNAFLSDLSTAVSNSIATDGQTTITANLPMAGFKFTGVGNASARDQFLAAGQMQDGGTNYAAAGGTADAITLALVPSITAYAIGQIFRFKTGAGANTTAVTLNVSAVGAGAVVGTDGSALGAGELQANRAVEVMVVATTPVFQVISQASTAVTQAQTDSSTKVATTAFVAGFGSSRAIARQVAAAGPVTAAGLPDFLPATDANLDLGSQNISGSYPFVVAAANGWSATTGTPVDRVGYSTANVTWTGLTASRAAATPNFLYVTVNADGTLTPGFTLVAPVYQFGGVPAVTNGLFTFNVAEMRGYLGNGATAPQAYVAFVGEAATDGSGVISTVAYAYNGYFESGFTATLPAAGVTVSASHNLGVHPKLAEFIVECTTIDSGYVVGQQIINPSVDNVTFVYPSHPYCTPKAMSRTSGNGGTGTDVINPSGGNNAALTVASWKYKFTAARGW